MSAPEILLEFAHELANAARAAILPYFRTENGVENKGVFDFDPVTLADRAAEDAMRKLIFSKRPNDAIHGEEFGIHEGNSGYEWVLDPIDGTRAFMAGTSTWGVLIGLYYEGNPLLGIMDQPFTGERWCGAPNNAHWHRGIEQKPLITNQAALNENSVLATTDPFLFHGEERLGFETLRKIAPVTRYGLDCTAYGLLAQGTIGLVVESGLKLVDIGALIPIVENAGGIFTDWKGNRNPIGGQIIAAANPKIHEEALKALEKAAN